MAEIEESLRDRTNQEVGGREEAASTQPSPGRSVADEIVKLQTLRDQGALSDEQYAKALDRTIAGEDSARSPRTVARLISR